MIQMRGKSTKTLELIEYALKLFEEDHPQTLRQLHYAVFSRQEIAYNNDQASYKRLSRATSAARRTYRKWELSGSNENPPLYAIPPSWMVDETRSPERTCVWTNATAYVDAVRISYRRDAWQDQPYHVEVWSEKATVLGSIRPVKEEYGITLRVLHGYGSTGMVGEVGSFFEQVGKPITVFFLGDHDPSGHNIERDIYGRVTTASGVDFSMQRLAIHPGDIKKFRLPAQKIKTSDSRAASFKRRFGARASTVELDALPAGELRRRVRDAVVGLIDIERWKRQLTVQEVELNCIAAFAERMKNLPQLNPEASA
jgi:hypothetical protein